jgi:hypothetical protein
MKSEGDHFEGGNIDLKVSVVMEEQIQTRNCLITPHTS